MIIFVINFSDFKFCNFFFFFPWIDIIDREFVLFFDFKFHKTIAEGGGKSVYIRSVFRTISLVNGFHGVQFNYTEGEKCRINLEN